MIFRKFDDWRAFIKAQSILSHHTFRDQVQIYFLNQPIRIKLNLVLFLPE